MAAAGLSPEQKLAEAEERQHQALHDHVAMGPDAREAVGTVRAAVGAAATAAAIHALTVLMAGSVWELSTAVLEARAGAAVRGAVGVNGVGPNPQPFLNSI